MIGYLRLTPVVLAACVLFACEKEPPKPATAPVAPKAAAGNTTPAPGSPASAAPTAATTTAPADPLARPVVPPPVPVPPPDPTPPPAPNTAALPVPATLAATDTQAKAQSLLDKIPPYLKGKQFADAEAALKELDGLKDQLPQALQDKIAQARAALNAAKLTSGDGVPFK